ncbi:MAG: hypothetical protein AAF743_06850 [Planctomycetota bacterium]
MSAAPFDPESIVARSLMPRRRVPPQYLLLAGVVLGTGAFLLATGAGAFGLPGRLAGIVLLGAGAFAAIGHVRSSAGRYRTEQVWAESLYDMIRLRKWDAARRLNARLLARDFINPQARVQVLTLWSMLLGRDGLHEQAAAVQGALLERIQGPATATLRTGRAMAQLRCDRLVDADATLRDLRRDLSSFEHIPDEAQAGLMLAEMFRDVQTNHLDEVLEVYEDHLPLLRSGLGVRVADVHLLAAVALHRRGDERWSDAWRKATLLSEKAELLRRYPEAAELPGAGGVGP